MNKKSQSFLALFIVAMAIFFYAIYLYNSYIEINNEMENYKKESEIVEKLKELKPGKCVKIDSYLKISSFTYINKGVIEIGPFLYSIKGLKLFFPDLESWPNDFVSYRFTNQTYTFAYLKNNEVYVQIIYPFQLKSNSKKGFIDTVCLENNQINIY